MYLLNLSSLHFFIFSHLIYTFPSVPAPSHREGRVEREEKGNNLTSVRFDLIAALKKIVTDCPQLIFKELKDLVFPYRGNHAACRSNALGHKLSNC